MIRDLGFHCRRDAQSLMIPAQVVVSEVQSKGGAVVAQRLAEPVRQSRKPAKAHPHREPI